MERYLDLFLQNAAGQTIFDQIEIVLDHNEPTDRELALVQAFSQKYPGRLKHIVTRPVRPIGASMNACIRNAAGRYLAIWNVDDLRTPNSLGTQVRSLMQEPDAGIAFGNYTIVSQFGSTEGTPVCNRDLPADEHNRGMTIGPFFMFRAELCERAGLFDEQLRSGADFDLALRLLSHARWTYTSDPLGYYLSAGMGASTRPDSLQWLEKNVIYMRYGIWDKFELEALPKLREYHPYELLIDGQSTPVARHFRDYEQTVQRRADAWLPRLTGRNPIRRRLSNAFASLRVEARNYRDAARAVLRRARRMIGAHDGR